MVMVSEERLRKLALEIEQLERAQAQAQADGFQNWALLSALSAQRFLVQDEYKRQTNDAADLRALLYNKTGGAVADMHPRSMIGIGLALRDAPGGTTGERRGPIVRAVFRGSYHGKTLTRGHELIQVLDEIVEVDGRDVRDTPSAIVQDLLVDAPGTRSYLTLLRHAQTVQVEIKRMAPEPNSSSVWKAHTQESTQALELHRTLNDLSLAFAHAAGKVRAYQIRASRARAATEEEDLQIQQLRLNNLHLLSLLKTLEAE